MLPALNHRQLKNLVFPVSVFIATFLLGLLAYGPALKGPAFFIDTENVLNAVPQGGPTPKNIWTVVKPASRSVFVPVMQLTYLVDQGLAGVSDQRHTYFVMRLGNLFYLSLAAAFCSLIFLYFYPNRVWAGMVGLLFAIHPLHAIPTVWVASRKDVLVCLFMLASAYYLLKKKNTLSLTAFALALLTKLSAYGLLIFIGAYLLLTQDCLSKKSLQKIILQALPFALIFLILFPLTYLNSSGPTATLWVGPQSFKLMGHYFIKTVFPYPITHYYPRPFPLGTWLTILSWLLMVGVALTITIQTLRKRLDIKWAVIFFLGLAFIFPYILVIPNSLIVNNAYAYSFVAAIVLGLGFLGAKGLNQKIPRLVLTILLGISIAWVTAYSHFLSDEFTRPIEAFNRNHALYPNSPLIVTRLAHAADHGGQTEVALKAYEKAIQMRIKKDSRIPIDAFKGLTRLCVRENKTACLKSLDTLAASNNRPYYCQELQAAVQNPKTTLRQCHKRFQME